MPLMTPQRNKLTKAFLTFLAGMISTISYAYDIVVPNEDGIAIYYSWTNNKTELAISNGEYDFSKVKSGKLAIPDSVSYKGMVYPVTSIEKRAFYYCSNLESVVIPNSVISIEEDAFNHCKDLNSVAIPNSVTSIEKRAFYCCSLKSLVIPNSITSIGQYVFSHCEVLKSVVIPYSVTSIGNGAFSGCYELNDVKIPNSVKTIGDYAFYGCHKMTYAILSDSLTSIGGYAFGCCFNLTSITIPESVISIGQAPFYANEGLASVKIYCNMDIDNTWFAYLEHLEEVVIGDKVKSIGDKAFYYCHRLKKITIPASITSIGESAFYLCKSLKDVSIPNSVMAIGKEAFRYCENLKKVTIEGNPDIDELAFQGCYLLDSIVIKSQTPPKMIRIENCVPGSDIYPFMNYTFTNAVLSIPEDYYDTYTASTWSLFKNICTYSENEYESVFENDSIYYTFQEDGAYVAARSIRGRKDYSGDGPLTPRDPVSGGQQPRVPTRTGVQETTTDPLDYTLYLGNIVIPESVSVFDTVYIVTGTNDYAFQGCYELESVSIPNSVKIIGYAGFAECTGLTEIIIPAGVELIDQYAFAYCSGLKRIVIEGNPGIDETAFIGCGTDIEVIYTVVETHKAVDSSSDTNGAIHYGIDGRRIQADTPGLHLIKRKDGSVVKALVR